MNRNNFPTVNQVKFLNWEFGVFFHFGIRTFYEGHRDWDALPMSAEEFNPVELDCKEWIAATKEAGARYAVLVCKHHDGFANWPSAYSDYSVANTPWKNGKGDVVREFVNACREYDIGVGVYYSPAQYGFQSNEEEYNKYFINQISELLGNYGKIDYLWFDACGSGDFKYDIPRIVKAIRSLQPEILIFNMWDPDTRWIGNEAGVTGLNNHNYVNKLDVSIDQANDMGLDSDCYLPGECDCCMRGHDWFYSDQNEYKLKTPDELIGMYYHSVGRGANLLINIGPDRRGKLPEKDKDLLIGLGKEVKRRFEDGKLPYRQTILKENGCTIYQIDLDEQPVNHLILSEDLSAGENVTSFRITAAPEGYGNNIDIYYGRYIGHKHICRFPTIITRHIEIIVEASAGEPALLDFYPVYVLC